MSGGAGLHDGSSEDNAFSLTEAIADSILNPTNRRYNVKKGGGYTSLIDHTFAAAATIAAPCIWRGYNTTIGDGDLGRSATTGRLVETNMPTINFTDATAEMTASGNYNIFQDLKITGISTAVMVTLSGTGASLVHCVVENTNTGASSHVVSLTGSGGLVEDCDVQHLGASGGARAVHVGAAAGALVHASRIRSISGPGLVFSFTSGGAASRCVIYGCGSHGVVVGGNNNTSNVAVAGCTVYNCAGNGIEVDATYAAHLRVSGCRITDNTGIGIDGNGATAAIVVSNCAVIDNAGGNISIDAEWQDAVHGTNTTNGDGSSADYADAAGGDFRLVAEALGVDDSAMGQNIGACGTDPASIEAGVEGGGGQRPRLVFIPLRR